MNRRMADEFEFSASDTLSETCDNASDFDEQPQNPLQLAPEWAVSRQHQQQRLVVNALWEVPIGYEEPGKPPLDNWVVKVFGPIELAPIFTVDSGRPVNPRTEVDTFGTHSYPLSARPAGFGRNSFAHTHVGQHGFSGCEVLPAGILEDRAADLVAWAFNLFNRANVAQINPVFGAGAVFR
jgi:hypothetical protein